MRPRRGTSLIEVAIATAMAALVLLGLGAFVASSFRANHNERDRAFALQKALQMMEEVSAFKPADAHDPGLDKFSGQPDFALTTADGAVPNDALSGNPKVGNFYKYVRTVTISEVSGDNYARKVTVQVWYAPKDALPHVPTGGTAPLAVVSNVVRSNASRVGPSQVLDIYALSIENLPHVLRKDDDNQYFPGATDARRMFEAALRTVQDRNPWLGFRVHYISRLSVGRDPYYRPAINDAKALTGDGRDTLDDVYFYPGRLTPGLDGPRYYDPDNMACDVTRFAPGGSVAVGQYAACDQFNQAVRYDRELDAAGNPIFPAGTTTPSLRQFLEDLLTDHTGKYRNAILVNLHGEMFPAIPLRNYADAAKDPADPDPTSVKRRLVTQPYRLAFEAGADTVRLLVHPFMADGSVTPQAGGQDANIALSPDFPPYAAVARVTVRGVRPFLGPLDQAGSAPAGINDVTVQVVQRERLNAGDCPTCGDSTYQLETAWPPSAVTEFGASRKPHSGPHVTAAAAGGLDPHFDGDDLVIDLTGLDYDAHAVQGGGQSYGLPLDAPDRLLHGLQYFPDPYLPFLDEPSAGAPRNTARVMISFNLAAAGAHHRFDVVTQLRKADGTLAADDPADPATSRTSVYAVAPGDWDGTKGRYWDATADRPAIPLTEQVQLVGDPRHNPYLDVRARNLFNPYFSAFDVGHEVYKGVSNQGATTLLDAANLFSGLNAAAGTGVDASYPGSADSWAGMKFNAPAYLRLWREAIVRNDILFVNPNGLPVRFLGQGGEFTLARKVDDLGDLHISSKPYDGGAGNADAQADELLGSTMPFIERVGGDRWHALPWLGELYPSDRGASWLASGNLPTGAFARRPLDRLGIWSYGTDQRAEQNRREVGGMLGLAAFLDAEAGAGSGPPLVQVGGQTASLTPTGDKVMTDALGLMLTRDPQTPVGYTLSGGLTPPEWASPPYATHDTLGWLDAPSNPVGYFAQSQGDGHFTGSPLRLGDAMTTHQAIVLADTFRAEGSSQSLSALQSAAGTLVGAFFDGTRPGLGPDNIKPLPRVKFKAPVAGDGITGTGVDLVWYAHAGRGDGKPYSPLFTYDDGLAPDQGGPLDVVFFVKFRNLTANGPWTTAALSGAVQSAMTANVDGVPVVDGQPVIGGGVVPVPNLPRYPSPIQVHWDIGDLAAGDYLLRVEAFRVDGGHILPTHYAFHEIPLTLAH